MAKIINQTIEIKVCCEESYSPVALSQTIELEPNETCVPQDLEKWCLDHLSSLAVQYAKRIKEQIVQPKNQMQPQPQVTATYSTGNQYQQNYQSYNNGNNNYNNNFNNYGGGNELEMLLSTQVPQQIFGKTTPAGYKNYGYTLRACSQKELNYLAYTCKKTSNSQIGGNARRLLELGYQGC